MNNDEIQYLILKSYEMDSYWGFAKGHMEGQETEEQTCIREVFEETGIKINIENDFRVVDKYMLTKDDLKEVVIFLGEVKGQSVIIQKEEIMEYRWCNYNTALKLITFAGSKGMLHKANKYLMYSK